MRSLTTRVRRGAAALAAGVLATIGLGVAAPSANADSPFGHPMPPGHWSFVRGDAYLHYACKIPMSGGYGPVYRVKTLTWYNGDTGAVNQGIGAYVATSRFRDSTTIDVKSTTSWYLGFAQTQVWASAYYADRLWIQGAYYGPAQPWRDGVPVRTLVNC